MNISFQNMIQQNNVYKNIRWIAVGIVCTLLIAVAISEGKWLYLGLLLIPFLIYLCITKPFIFPFGLYVALLPTEGLPLLMLGDGGDGSSVMKLLGILTIMVILFKGIFEKRLKRPDSAALWWTLLIVYGLLSVLWAIQPELLLEKLPTVGGLFILYLVVSSYKWQKSDFDTIKWCSVGGGMVAATLAVLNYMTNPDNPASIIAGGPTNKISFAFLIPFAVSASMMFGQDKTMKKTFGSIASGWILFGIIVTGSRGNMLGALAVFLYHILFMKQDIKQKAINIILTIITAVVIISFLPGFFSARWGIAIETGGAHRSEIWYMGYKSLEKYWLFGAGMENFIAINKEYGHYLNDRDALASHNIYIAFVVELGIIGSSLMVMAIVKHYQALRSKLNLYIMDHTMLKAAFWGVLVASIFIHSQWTKSFWLLWMMILMHKTISAKN